MTEPTRLAIPLISADPPLSQQVAAAAGTGAELVELRVDAIGRPAAVEALLRGPRTLPFILTIRHRAEGGLWDAGETERAALFARLAALRPGFLDVEFAAWRASPALQEVTRAACAPAAGGGNRLILSHHDCHNTPADLDARIAPLLASPADVIKVACLAQDATDAWRLLGLLQQWGHRRPMIVLAMGAAGLLSRVLARKCGAFLTFAALTPGGQSAPGQPTAAELLDLYRWRELGPATGICGLLGWPVSHSLSPRVHNQAMAAAGIDGVYVPMPVAPDFAHCAALLDLLTAAPANPDAGHEGPARWAALDVHGLSVTIPHKVHALRWLVQRGCQISPAARRIGAVNTLVRTAAGQWSGDNTDMDGIVAALDGAGLLRELRSAAALVLGAGGVARAAVVALQDLGTHVTVVNRTPERAAALAAELGCDWGPWETRDERPARLIVNCTSIGMAPEVDAMPLHASALRPGTAVLDTVYTPAQTRLLREAQARGCQVISGMNVFLGQAAAQSALWHPGPRRRLRRPGNQ